MKEELMFCPECKKAVEIEGGVDAQGIYSKCMRCETRIEESHLPVTVKVLMLAFMEGEIREVRIPSLFIVDVDTYLNEVFRLGQNDFQRVVDRCSVSTGDVIIDEIFNEGPGPDYYKVASFGFEKMTAEQLEEYKKLDCRDRLFHSLS